MPIITADETQTLATPVLTHDEAFPSTEISVFELFGVAVKICEASQGQVQLVRNEEDKDSSPADDAAEFLKFNGERIGRDIRTYNLISRAAGVQYMMTTFFEEVALPLRSVLPAAYEAIKPDLIVLGERVFAPNMQSAWRDLVS